MVRNIMNNLIKIRRKYIIEIRDKMVDKQYEVFKGKCYNIYKDDYIAAECKQSTRECFNKIVNTEWESDIEFLLRYQAEAFYRVGQICVIEKDYDTECKYLLMDVYGSGIDRCKINKMKVCFDNAEKLLEELVEKNTSKKLGSVIKETRGYIVVNQRNLL